MDGTQAQNTESKSKMEQYWQRKLLYNYPAFMDTFCYQPTRFLLMFYISNLATAPFIKWLKHSTNTNSDNQSIWSLIANSFGKMIVSSYKLTYKYLFPQALKSHIISPFEWTPFEYQISHLLIASIGSFTSLIFSYLYFRKISQDQSKWPYVYEHLMNADFNNCIDELLNDEPLNDNFHIDLTLKLYPIIKFNYFNQRSRQNESAYNHFSPSPQPVQSKVFEFKLVQFTAANSAWYCTKWDRVSIQCKQYRIVGALLCDYDENMEEIKRKSEKREIVETVQKIKRMRLNELNIGNKLDWCKNMCLTLQNHFDGEWIVMIGHRVQYRSYHSVLLKENRDNYNSYEQQSQMTQKVAFEINNKTDAEFIQFGFGPSWYNWSVIVAKLQ